MISFFKKPGRKQLLLYLIFLLLIVVFLNFREGETPFGKANFFVLNQTKSLPNYAFWVKRDQIPQVGDYVYFHPPKTKYYPDQKFIKKIYGGEGDIVQFQGRKAYINNQYIVTAKEVSTGGDPLNIGPTGKIPKNCYFVATEHKDGFDSRYDQIGWICLSRIIGIAHPIL